MSTFAYPPTAVVPESNWTQNQGGSAMNQYSFQFDTLPTYMTAGSHLESPQFYENRRYGCAFCHSMASSSWTVTDQGYLICSSCLSCSNWIPASSPPSSSPASYSPPTHSPDLFFAFSRHSHHLRSSFAHASQKIPLVFTKRPPLRQLQNLRNAALAEEHPGTRSLQRLQSIRAEERLPKA
ncbi:hypothetical protein L596_016658 [Steinernema carpocapsae]|uniref:GATA-type domain-containing protein n=1 Tax=Steinernema carpocapsae TaxID=34508 RepID=A0A4U5NIK7_STECR|nr:hypothetical protein L596_016658 [Steinernema carpocapsae]